MNGCFKMLALAVVLGTAAPALAQQDAAPEPVDSHGKIKPTSSGSSGTAGGSAAGSDSMLFGGATDMESTGRTGGNGIGAINPSTAPNPYPNAANSPTGQINGGSVNGTGAFSSAFPH